MSDYRVFDSFQDAIMVIDADHNVHYGNEAACMLFELPARRLNSGKNFEQLITLEPQALLDHAALLSLTEATQVREVAFTSSTGKQGWGQVFQQPQPSFFDPSGSQVGDHLTEAHRFIVCVRDVSLEKTLHDKYRAELDQKESVIRDLREARAKLEDYSRNLEIKVEERTADLRKANVLLKTILDSLGQGILVFDEAGMCLPVYSQICLKMFGIEPAGRRVEDVLHLQAGEKTSFGDWRQAVYGAMLDFEDLVPLAPERFKSLDGLEIFLDYNQMTGADGRIEGIVVVATDRTREMQALRDAEKERALVRRIVQVARNREAFRLFVNDARTMLASLESSQELQTEEISRQLHTVKGGAATFALETVVRICHELEDRLKDLAQGLDAATFMMELRDRAKLISANLDQEIRDISELLGPIVDASGQTESLVEMSLETCLSWVERLLAAKNPDDIRRIATEILVQCSEKPLGDFVRPYSESLEELAERLGKRLAPLEIIGGETKAPIRFVSGLLSSLVHAFRNAIDHGIEATDERLANGKKPEGLISVQFERVEASYGSDLMIEITDDGRGVNVERVRAKLIANGQSDVADLSDDEVCQFILKGDLSTAEKITEISGRGVGLSAVTEEVARLGGKIRVASRWQQGCTIRIEIPLTQEVENFSRGAA